MNKLMNYRKQEIWTGWAFMAPFLIGFALFVVIPLFYTLWLSFMGVNSISEFMNPRFVGLQNYIDVLDNKDSLLSYWRSFHYTLVYVPTMIILSFSLALLLNKKASFRNFSRTMIFMPYVANVTAVAIVVNVLFNPYGGPINTLLNFVGIDNPPQWLMDPNLALSMGALVAVWQNLPFQTIVYLAALQDVPGELYEAAHMEGASWWHRVRYVTLPLISPTTFFLVVTTIIGSTQNFSSIYTLTQGGPGDASEVAIISIYKSAFFFNQFGIASAQSVFLFLVLLAVTIIQWRGQKKWVHY